MTIKSNGLCNSGHHMQPIASYTVLCIIIQWYFAGASTKNRIKPPKFATLVIHD